MPAALTDFDITTLGAELATWGFKPSHGRRVLAAFYGNAGRIEYANLPMEVFGVALPQELQARIAARQSTVLTERLSGDGTLKLLVGFDGGGAVETVLMPAYRHDRAAGCVSSQIGCAMGCDFCASTRNGLERNLSAGEIVEQFLHLRQRAEAQGRRLTSLVFMGMGEPMHNLDHVIAAIRRIADHSMGALGWRQITVSTVGIVPGIDRLAEADLNVQLAVSLHAPDDATRAAIVPAGRRYGVADIMAATRRFASRTGRIPTIEYCLLAGVNDSDEQAGLLARLLAAFKAHVNVIPYNQIGAGLSGRVYETSAPQRLAAFVAILRQGGVVAHIRRTRGDDVNAACGQLQAMVELSRKRATGFSRTRELVMYERKTQRP